MSNTSNSSSNRRYRITSLLLCVCLSMIANIIYNLYYLYNRGYQKAIDNQINHSKYLDQYVLSKETELKNYLPSMNNSFAEEYEVVESIVNRYADKTKKTINSEFTNTLFKKMDKGIEVLMMSKDIIMLSAYISYQKIKILVLALPLFFMTTLAGFVDGLSRRDIRRSGLGRESSYMFHKLIGWVMQSISIGLLCWFVFPLAISPSLVFILASTAMMFSVSMASSKFKKYL